MHPLVEIEKKITSRLNKISRLTIEAISALLKSKKVLCSSRNRLVSSSDRIWQYLEKNRKDIRRLNWIFFALKGVTRTFLKSAHAAIAVLLKYRLRRRVWYCNVLSLRYDVIQGICVFWGESVQTVQADTRNSSSVSFQFWSPERRRSASKKKRGSTFLFRLRTTGNYTPCIHTS